MKLFLAICIAISVLFGFADEEDYMNCGVKKNGENNNNSVS